MNTEGAYNSTLRVRVVVRNSYSSNKQDLTEIVGKAQCKAVISFEHLKCPNLSNDYIDSIYAAHVFYSNGSR